MGFFSSKIKIKTEELESAFIQLQNQIVENGKLRTQLNTEIEKSKQLNEDYAEQVDKNNNLKEQLQIQVEKVNQISGYYNKLMSQYKELKDYIVNLEKQLHEYELKEQAQQTELRKMYSIEDFVYEDDKTEEYEKNCKDLKQEEVSKCFTAIPL